jgi:hypothetical protein
MKLIRLGSIILNVLNELFVNCIDNVAIGYSSELLLPIHHISDFHQFLLVSFVTPKGNLRKFKILIDS